MTPDLTAHAIRVSNVIQLRLWEDQPRGVLYGMRSYLGVVLVNFVGHLDGSV